MPTPCWKDGGAGVIFYSETGYSGQSWTYWVAPEDRDSVVYLPDGIKGHLGSFKDTNNAWHVILFHQDQSFAHFDSSRTDVGFEWYNAVAVKIYINGCEIT